ncbi:hypothetical protein VR010_00210 [Actinomycetaceae bacterium L2_0104]
MEGSNQMGDEAPWGGWRPNQTRSRLFWVPLGSAATLRMVVPVEEASSFSPLINSDFVADESTLVSEKDTSVSSG